MREVYEFIGERRNGFNSVSTQVGGKSNYLTLALVSFSKRALPCELTVKIERFECKRKNRSIVVAVVVAAAVAVAGRTGNR